MRRSFRKTAAGCALSAGLFVALAPAAHADKWLKIMPDDPYSTDGSFHQFDVDSAFEDMKTGYVAARMVYAKPENAMTTKTWFVWAFDCKGSVYYVSSPGDTAGAKPDPDWRTKAKSLAEPVMGGVTNTFGTKLCALKGSWPKGALP